MLQLHKSQRPENGKLPSFPALSGDYRERQMQPGPLLSFRLLPSHQPLQGQGTKWLILRSFAGMVFPSSHPKQSQDALFVDFTAYLV